MSLFEAVATDITNFRAFRQDRAGELLLFPLQYLINLVRLVFDSTLSSDPSSPGLQRLFTSGPSDSDPVDGTGSGILDPHNHGPAKDGASPDSGPPSRNPLSRGFLGNAVVRGQLNAPSVLGHDEALCAVPN